MLIGEEMDEELPKSDGCNLIKHDILFSQSNLAQECGSSKINNMKKYKIKTH